MSDTATKLRAYIAMMAPHQRERLAGRLLEDSLASIEALEAEVERLRNDLHSCGPTCDRAGCVNARLRAELAALRTPDPSA